MAAPTYRPEVDTNAARQPADPAGIPAATKSDGFREIEPVPNTSWNWLFKTINDWIGWLLAKTILVQNTGAAASGLGETSALSAIIAANTVVVSKTVIKMVGSFEVTATVGGGLIQMIARVGDLGTPLGSLWTASAPPVGATLHLEVELVMGTGNSMGYTIRTTHTDAVGVVTGQWVESGVTTVNPGPIGTYSFSISHFGTVGMAWVSRAQSFRLELI